MINDSGLTRLLSLLDDDLTVIAIGNGTPSRTSSQLSLETLRKQVDDSLTDGFILVKDLTLDENEGNGSITEIGILCNSATTASGSGDLFASTSADIEKDNTQSLTISFEIEVAEVS